MTLSKLLLWASAYGLVVSHFPPKPEGLTTIQSEILPGVSISCKKVSSNHLHLISLHLDDSFQRETCETTPGVKSFSGYVHLSPTLDPAVQPYPNNLFLWFNESRKDPANTALAIYIDGRPGYSPLIAVGSKNGPCPINVKSNSTTLNRWSWDNEVNMLYVDHLF